MTDTNLSTDTLVSGHSSNNTTTTPPTQHCIQIQHRATTYKQYLNPDTKLSDLLQQFCAEHNLTSTDWYFYRRSSRTTLNPQHTIKQAGLEYNCAMELLPSATAQKSTTSAESVRIALEIVANAQLNITSSRTELVANSTAMKLYDVLLQYNTTIFEQTYNNQYIQPVISFNSSTYDTIQSLYQHTLKSLGIKYSVKMRLSYKLIDRQLVDVSSEISSLQQSELKQRQQEQADIEAQRQHAATQAELAIAEEQSRLVTQRQQEQRNTMDVQRVNSREELFELCSSDLDELAGNTDAPSIQFTTAVNVLYKIVDNLIQSRHNRELKYRTLRIDSGALYNKLTQYQGGRDLLQHIGFEPDNIDSTRYTMTDDTEDEILLDKVHELFRVTRDHEQSNSSNTNMQDRERSPHSVPSSTVQTDTIDDRDAESIAYDAEIQRLRDQANALEQRRNVSKQRPTESSTGAVMTNDINNTSQWHELDELRSPEPEVDDTDMSVDNEPEYHISDVRTALNTLLAEVQNNKTMFLQITELLRKITDNILKHNDAKYRSINLTNKTLAAKLSPYTGAIQYLLFLGFNYADSSNPLVLTLSNDNEHKLKIQRAFSVLSRIIQEQQLTEDEQDAIRLGPIERNIQVYAYNAAYARTQQNNESNSTVQADTDSAQLDTPADEKVDLKLLLQASSQARQRYEQLSRTDIIVTKTKHEEMKKELERKYEYCIVRVILLERSDQTANSSSIDNHTMIQSQYRPFETLNDVIGTLGSVLSNKDGDIELLIPPNRKLSQQAHGHMSLKQLEMLPACTLMCKSINNVPASSLLSEQYAAIKQPMNRNAIEIPKCVNLEEIEQAKKRHAAMFSMQQADDKVADVDDMDDIAELKRLQALRRSNNTSQGSNKRSAVQPKANR